MPDAPAATGHSSAHAARAARLGVVAVCAVLAVAAGCRDVRRVADPTRDAPSSAPAALAADAAPEEVARALLETVYEIQQLRRGGLASAEARTRYVGLLSRLASLSNRRAIHAALRQNPSPLLPRDITEALAVKTMTESWIAVLAHYIDGLPQARFEPAAGAATEFAEVRVELANPREAAELVRIRDEPSIREIARREGEDSGPHIAALRARAIERGFNVPIETIVVIRMERRSAGGWGVVRVEFDAPRRPRPPGGGTLSGGSAPPRPTMNDPAASQPVTRDPEAPAPATAPSPRGS